jgi:hypothetical protein
MANSSSQTPGPTSADPLTHTLALIQPWINYVPQQQRRLGVFIVFALMIHIATFFFIKITTSRAELQHQTHIHVSVEYPQAVAVDGKPADDLWNRLTDPRLFLFPVNPLASLSSDQPMLEESSNLGSTDLPAPALPEAYRAARPAAPPLQQRVVEAMAPPRQPFFYDETPPAIANKTTWQWDDALALRQPTALPDLPSPISDTDLSPTILRVAVSPTGTVEHVMVEQSAGGLGASIAKDLDQQAVLAASRIRFKPTDQAGMVWGNMTVFWRYSAKPSEEVVPTPPTTGP